MKKYYWTMKNGEKIDVDDMSESHLRNTLKLIIRSREDNTFRGDESSAEGGDLNYGMFYNFKDCDTTNSDIH